MDLNTVLTHGLTYLAALALPLWLLGEQIAGWWILRKPKAGAEEKAAPAASAAPSAAHTHLERKAA